MATKTKKPLDWPLAPDPENRELGSADNLLAWISGLILGGLFLLGGVDLFDFMKDPSEHAIGQGSALVDGWQQRYVLNSVAMLFLAIVLLTTVIYAARHPERRWTAIAIRMMSAVVIGIVLLGITLG